MHQLVSYCRQKTLPRTHNFIWMFNTISKFLAMRIFFFKEKKKANKRKKNPIYLFYAFYSLLKAFLKKIIIINKIY